MTDPLSPPNPREEVAAKVDKFLNDQLNERVEQLLQANVAALDYPFEQRVAIVRIIMRSAFMGGVNAQRQATRWEDEVGVKHTTAPVEVAEFILPPPPALPELPPTVDTDITSWLAKATGPIENRPAPPA